MAADDPATTQTGGIVSVATMKIAIAIPMTRAIKDTLGEVHMSPCSHRLQAPR